MLQLVGDEGGRSFSVHQLVGGEGASSEAESFSMLELIGASIGAESTSMLELVASEGVSVRAESFSMLEVAEGEDVSARNRNRGAFFDRLQTRRRRWRSPEQRS